jgi:hypothetical protein
MNQELKAIREVTGKYNPYNIYNLYETALDWKRLPERFFATSSKPGLKVLKN